ncbi:hypothetical protein [Sandaracinobacteroides saxicola]|uniref:Uncharacterized protein n=1 Tax=Sandaracinobacteroides saxicola TaxID=2759707 RepID=A0A7G5ILK4_9SPHN|nr:hypothetical protein [Sandaracinobacteroides saxicola]QMW24246.1 hypothetical protein H3309_07275 [Sandaracinobacteroides saxicola]
MQRWVVWVMLALLAAGCQRVPEERQQAAPVDFGDASINKWFQNILTERMQRNALCVALMMLGPPEGVAEAALVKREREARDCTRIDDLPGIVSPDYPSFEVMMAVAKVLPPRDTQVEIYGLAVALSMNRARPQARIALAALRQSLPMASARVRASMDPWLAGPSIALLDGEPDRAIELVRAMRQPPPASGPGSVAAMKAELQRMWQTGQGETAEAEALTAKMRVYDESGREAVGLILDLIAMGDEARAVKALGLLKPSADCSGRTAESEWADIGFMAASSVTPAQKERFIALARKSAELRALCPKGVPEGFPAGY